MGTLDSTGHNRTTKQDRQFSKKKYGCYAAFVLRFNLCYMAESRISNDSNCENIMILTSASMSSISSLEGCSDLCTVLMAWIISAKIVSTRCREGGALHTLFLCSLALRLNIVPLDPSEQLIAGQKLHVDLAITRTLKKYVDLICRKKKDIPPMTPSPRPTLHLGDCPWGRQLLALRNVAQPPAWNASSWGWGRRRLGSRRGQTLGLCLIGPWRGRQGEMKMASVVQHLSDGQLCQNKKRICLPALGAEDVASSSLLVLFPVRGIGLGSRLCLPLGPTDLLTGADSGGGCIGLGTRCDDLRATQRGNGRRERETLEEVEKLDAGVTSQRLVLLDLSVF
jgi:hypothetical protein